MDKFTNYVEIQAEKAENLSFCRGIKLLYIRDKVETMLEMIGRGSIFEEYTIHNITHIDQMLKIVEWLIPEKTKKSMTYAEWLMLTLAIYFHDLGMVVTRDEFADRDKTTFKDYVFDSRVLEVVYSQDVNMNSMFKQLLENRFIRVSNELIEKMWIRIDKNEFIDKVLVKNYTLYSIDNWSRKDDVF